MSRPRSSSRNDKKQEPQLDISAKLANLDRMKNASSVEKFDWSSMTSIGDMSSQHLMSSPSRHAWEEKGALENEKCAASSGSVICADCDKTYLSTRDLEIHKNFCYGKISK